VFSGFDDTITGGVPDLKYRLFWITTLPTFSDRTLTLQIGTGSAQSGAQLIFGLQTAAVSVPNYGPTVPMLISALAGLFLVHRRTRIG
jgi:hypothetical protein